MNLLEEEIRGLEDRDLGADDVIKEEDEEEDDGPDDDGDVDVRGEDDAIITPKKRRISARPKYQPRSSILKRFIPFGQRRKCNVQNSHDADIYEATMGPSRSNRLSAGNLPAVSGSVGSLDPPSPVIGSRPVLGRRRALSTGQESSDDRMGSSERRTSISSNSSHERDIWSTSAHLSLGLVEMDQDMVPDFAKPSANSGDEIDGLEEDRPVFVWTANHDRATVLRIGFKKRISAVWLEVYSLKQYVDLNLTAFEKILKK